MILPYMILRSGEPVGRARFSWLVLYRFFATGEGHQPTRGASSARRKDFQRLTSFGGRPVYPCHYLGVTAFHRIEEEVHLFSHER